MRDRDKNHSRYHRSPHHRPHFHFYPPPHPKSGLHLFEMLITLFFLKLKYKIYKLSPGSDSQLI